MGVPGQSITEGVTKVFGSLRLFKLNIVDLVRCADDFTLVGNSDQFAFVRVEVHLPVCFPVL